MNNTRIAQGFVLIVVLVSLVFLHVIRDMGALKSASIDPMRVNVINFEKGGYELYDKNSDFARELIAKAYGPYAPWIMKNDVEISIPEETEFALPTFKIDGGFYAYRESPTMPMHLWQQQSPEVVLLGSSMFFMNFNRTTFFEKHPDVRLLDMTMGNNTPLLSKYLLDTAEKLDLKIKPGTVFVYGMNAVELLDFYYPPFPHVERAFALEFMTESVSKTIEMRMTHFLHVAVVKERLDNWLRVWVVNNEALLRDWVQKLSYHIQPMSNAVASVPTSVPTPSPSDARQSDPDPKDPDYKLITQPYLYSPHFPPRLENDPKGLREFFKKMAPKWDGVSYDSYPYGEDKVAALKAVADKIKAAGGTLIIVKVPTSTLGFLRSPSSEHAFHLKAAETFDTLGIPYIDLTPWEKTGLDDTYFVYPRHTLNPEHLNYEGSDIFTKYLMTQIIEPHLERK